MQYAPPGPDVQAPGPTTIHKLLAKRRDLPFTEVQMIFGHMVRLAVPVMQSYYSDLWFDAMWLQDHMQAIAPDEHRTFHWYLASTHTFISTDVLPATYHCGQRTAHYVLTVYQAQATGWWSLAITLQNPEGA